MYYAFIYHSGYILEENTNKKWDIKKVKVFEHRHPEQCTTLVDFQYEKL